MLNVVFLYIALLIPTDSVKPAVHYVTPLPAVVDSQRNQSLTDTTIYLETDSALCANFPSIDRMNNMFPPSTGLEIIPGRQNRTQVFIAVLLLISLVTVALVRGGYPKEFEELFSVLRSIPLTQQIYRVQTNSLNMPLALLTVNAVLSFSLSIYFIVLFERFNLKFSGSSLFFIIASMVSLLFIYRLGSGLFTGILFPVKKEMSFYGFCTLQILRIAGIVLLPLNILFAFGNASWQQGTAVLTIIAILVLIGFIYARGFLVTKDLFRHNKFHFLLYICTLEIAPALTLIKFLMDWVRK